MQNNMNISICQTMIKTHCLLSPNRKWGSKIEIPNSSYPNLGVYNLLTFCLEKIFKILL